MNIKKGKISNLNKKLIAGLITVTLAAPLVGCDNLGFDPGIAYIYNSGEYEILGKVDYVTMKNSCFLVIENSENQNVEYYIASPRQMFGKGFKYFIIYENVLNGEAVFEELSDDENTKTILVCDNLESYLIAFNKVQDKYTSEEIEGILGEIKADYEPQKDKQLVKE